VILNTPKFSMISCIGFTPPSHVYLAGRGKGVLEEGRAVTLSSELAAKEINTWPVVMGTIMLDHKFLVYPSTIYARAWAKYSARA